MASRNGKLGKLLIVALLIAAGVVAYGAVTGELRQWLSLSSTPKQFFVENWARHAAGNLTVYYSPEDISADEIVAWTAAQRRSFEAICAYLCVDWRGGPVEIVVFKDRRQARKFGHRIGLAADEKQTIFTSVNRISPHDLAELAPYQINQGHVVKSPLIREGLATFLNGRQHDYYLLFRRRVAANSLKADNLLDGGFRKLSDGNYLAASFVAFLIQRNGIGRFREFLAQDRYGEDEAFAAYYEQDFETLFDEWVAYLAGLLDVGVAHANPQNAYLDILEGRSRTTCYR